MPEVCVYVVLSLGTWSYQNLVGSLEVSTIKLSAFDPLKAWLSGPEKGVVGESVTFTGNIL